MHRCGAPGPVPSDPLAHRTAGAGRPRVRPTERRVPAVAYTVLLVGQLAVGSAAILARWGLDAGVPASALAAWRLALAALLVLGVGAVRGRRACRDAPLPASLRWKLVAAGICLGLHFVTWFQSLRMIPVGRSTLLVSTTPVFSGLLGVLLLHHRLARKFWIGLAIATGGVALITAGPAALRHSADGPEWLGDLLAVAGAALIGIYLLIVQDEQAAIGTRRVIAWTYSTAAVSMWALVPLLSPGRALLPASGAAWGAIVGLALVPQLVGHTAINWSLRHFPAGVVSAAALLEPVFAAALAWPIFGEPVRPLQALGAAFVLIGVGLAIQLGDRPPAEPGPRNPPR